MTSDYIDITFPLTADLPIWPNSSGFAYQWHVKIANGATNNSSSFTIDSHFGTHIDAPLHFVKDGKTIQDVPFDKLIGLAFVAEIRNKKSITAKDLNTLPLPKNCKKLLLKTDNQNYWESGTKNFQEDFCSIDKSGAQWIVDNQIDLIGIDYLSIQRFHDGPQTHQILLTAEVVVLETINLRNVAQGVYELICLPLKFKNLEASPVRAILRKI